MSHLPIPAAAVALALLTAVCGFVPAPAQAQSGGLFDRMRERATERARSQTENEAGQRVDSAVDGTVDCMFDPVECAKKVPTTKPADSPGTPPSSGPGTPAGAPGTPPSADATAWYAESQGKRIGPMPRNELDAMVVRGEIEAGTLVWREGMSGWTAAGSVEELTPVFKKLPPPLPPERSGPPPLPSR